MLLSPLESALHHLDALEQDAAEGVGPTLDGPMRRHHLRATRRALEAMVNATGGATTMFTPTVRPIRLPRSDCAVVTPNAVLQPYFHTHLTPL